MAKNDSGPARPAGALLGALAVAAAFVGGAVQGLTGKGWGRTRTPGVAPPPARPDGPTSGPGARPSAASRTPAQPTRKASGWSSLYPRAVWTVLKDSGSEWMEDKCPRLGAALAYYTAFSLAPLLVIVITIAGFLWGGQNDYVKHHILGQVKGMMGAQGGEAVQGMVESASKQGHQAGILAAVTGILMLLFGAISLFGELQDALNTVWEVQPKPGRGIWGILRDRLLSLSMVMGVAFLLLVSLVISAALAALGGLLGDWQSSVLGGVINGLVSFVVITLLFAMIFRFLPDAKVSWGDVWLGAALTAVLFVVGKFALGLYLGRASVASSYGAAGSFAVLLIWIYYSAQIFLFGAEFTKSYAGHYGSRIVPAENAEPVTEEARAEQGIPHSRPKTAPEHAGS